MPNRSRFVLGFIESVLLNMCSLRLVGGFMSCIVSLRRLGIYIPSGKSIGVGDLPRGRNASWVMLQGPGVVAKMH